MLENRGLRGIFRPARKGVPGCEENLHNDEIQEVHFSPHKMHMVK